MLIDDILEAEKRDPSLWNSLPSLGWEGLLRIELEWRNSLESQGKEVWGQQIWRRIYQKLRRALQHTYEYKEFRRYILDRDGCCRKCGSEEKLQVHHKKSWFKFPSLRMDEGNCEVQCEGCHKQEDSSKWFHAKTHGVRSKAS